MNSFYLKCNIRLKEWNRLRRQTILRNHTSSVQVKQWHKLIKRQNCHHIETSQLICKTNQLTGFYMMATLKFNELNENRLVSNEVSFPRLFHIIQGVRVVANSIWTHWEKLNRVYLYFYKFFTAIASWACLAAKISLNIFTKTIFSIPLVTWVFTETLNIYLEIWIFRIINFHSWLFSYNRFLYIWTTKVTMHQIVIQSLSNFHKLICTLWRIRLLLVGTISAI